MRFLFTLNMPPGNLDRVLDHRNISPKFVHQVIGDHKSESCEELAEEMNDKQFIVVRQWYYDTDRQTGEKSWVDRGELILNTNQVGKISAHYFQGSAPIKPIKRV